MFYGLLANLIFLIHLLFIVYVSLGGLLSYRWKYNVFFHVPAFLYGLTVELFVWVCPLTPLENWLLKKAGQSQYDSGFVEQYLEPIIYPSDFSLTMQLSLAGLVFAINAAVYFPMIFHKWNR